MIAATGFDVLPGDDECGDQQHEENATLTALITRMASLTGASCIRSPASRARPSGRSSCGPATTRPRAAAVFRQLRRRARPRHASVGLAPREPLRGGRRESGLIEPRETEHDAPVWRRRRRRLRIVLWRNGVEPIEPAERVHRDRGHVGDDQRRIGKRHRPDDVVRNHTTRTGAVVEQQAVWSSGKRIARTRVVGMLVDVLQVVVLDVEPPVRVDRNMDLAERRQGLLGAVHQDSRRLVERHPVGELISCQTAPRRRPAPPGGLPSPAAPGHRRSLTLARCRDHLRRRRLAGSERRRERVAARQAADTAIAERGRLAGSGSRQRRIARSMPASRSRTMDDGGVTAASWCCRMNSRRLGRERPTPVKSSNRTSPSA